MKWIIGLVACLSGAQLIGHTLPANTTITDGATCVRMSDKQEFSYQGGRFINKAGFVLYTLEQGDSSGRAFMSFPNGISRQVDVWSDNGDEILSLLRLFPGSEWLILLAKDASLEPIFDCVAK